MRYLDLFSGIGGFALGLYWSRWRFEEHYYSEIDQAAAELYQLRFPEAIPLGDIRTIDPKELPGGEWFITGGFPCQDISYAGQGAGLSGARSGLWFEMHRVIDGLRPRFVIVENVSGLFIRGFGDVLGALAQSGYDAEWDCIRASDVGAPHRRERVWIVAYPVGLGDDRWSSSSGILQHGTQNEAPQGSGGDGGDAGRARVQGRPPNQSAYRPEVWYPAGGGYWSIEPDVGRLAHGIPRRVDRLRGLGNAVVPQIVAAIGEMIREAFCDRET